MNKHLPKGVSALRAFNSRALPSTKNLGLGKPWADMPSELRLLGQKILEDSSQRLDYSENAGLASVRSQLEAHYNLKKGSTILTHGAEEAIFAALFALLNPGDEVLVPNPGFVAYAPIVESLRGKVRYYNFLRQGDDFLFSAEKVLEQVSKKTKVVIVNLPGNPAGDLPSAKILKALVSALKKRGVIVLADEVYGELLYQGEFVSLARGNKNVVSINAFSKSHALTGWRIGWIAAEDDSIRQAALVAHQYITTCASVPAQRLVGALLGKKDLFIKIRDSFRSEYEKKRDLLFHELGKKTNSAAGFYAFLPIPKEFKSSLAFAQDLLSTHDILVIPGEFFGSEGKKFVRVSFAVPDEWIVAFAKAYRSYC